MLQQRSCSDRIATQKRGNVLLGRECPILFFLNFSQRGQKIAPWFLNSFVRFFSAFFNETNVTFFDSYRICNQRIFLRQNSKKAKLKIQSVRLIEFLMQNTSIQANILSSVRWHKSKYECNIWFKRMLIFKAPHTNCALWSVSGVIWKCAIFQDLLHCK